MRIDDQGPTSAAAAERAGSAARGGRAERAPADAQGNRDVAGPAARVELSGRSRELHQALAVAHAAPDVRAERVADVRAQLDAGTYVVDPTRIARGMLEWRA